MIRQCSHPVYRAMQCEHAVFPLARRLAEIRITDPDHPEYSPIFMLLGLKRLDLAFTPAR